MVRFLTLVMVFQLAGEVMARLLGLPVPGPVIGLVLFFVALTLNDRAAREVGASADRLLAYLSLLFIPAGVGVVQYLPLLADQWVAMSASIVGGAVAGIAATAVTMKALSPSSTKPEARA